MRHLKRPNLSIRVLAVACLVLVTASGRSAGLPRSTLAPAGADSTTLLATLNPTNIFEPVKGSVSPDGRVLVYEQVEGSNRQLWRLDIATGSRKQLTSTPGVRYDPAWSPDGRQIVYWAGVLYPASGETLQGLWVVSNQGGTERLVHQDSPADGGVISNPTWTPDGRVLFQASFVGIDRFITQLWRIGVDGRDLVRLTGGSEPQELGMTSPDGKRIAFIGSGCDGKGQALWLMNADGSHSSCLVRVASPIGPPHWSPDGSKLYLAALAMAGTAPPADAFASLFVVRSGDGASSRLPTPSGEVLGVSILADGKVIAGIHRPTPQIAILPIEGGRPVPLLAGEAIPTLRPAWRPDGRALGFTRGTWQRTRWQSNWHSASVKVDSGRASGSLEKMTGLPRGATDPAWSPNGRILAFARATQSLFGALRVDRVDGETLLLANADHSTATTPAWTPDGDAVVLPGGEYGNLNKTDKGRDLGAGRNGIVIATNVPIALEDTSRWKAPVQALTLEGFDGTAAAPAVSPDGRWIAFGERWLQGESGVYIVSSTGGRVQRVASAGSGDSFGGPEWTADGRSLIFSRADGLGGFQLVKVLREGGSAERLTPSDVAVLHPRRSPDGRSLAVTLWSAPTEFRLVSAIAPSPAPAPVRPPADQPSAIASAAEIAPEIMALANRVSETADTVTRHWPGVWSREQSFVVVAPAARQTLIVAPTVPLVGAVPVASSGLHPRLQGRTFLLRTVLNDPRALGLPFVTVDALPAEPTARREVEERLLAGLYYLRFTGSEDPQLAPPGEWRLILPSPPLDRVSPSRAFAHQPTGYGCPLDDASSCAAMVQLEQRILRDALRGPRDSLRSRLRDYVSVRWVRMLSDFTSRRGELTVERGYGTAGYLARRAALLATGGSLTRYQAELTRTLGSTRGDESSPREKMPRLRATAEATALLLDRLEVQWRPSPGDSASLLDVLSRASGFDSTFALPSLVRLMRDYDYPALVADARQRAPKPEKPTHLSPAYHLHRYFARALEALDDSAGVRPLIITLRNKATDTARVRVDIEPGPAGKITAGPGYAIYPDARRVRLNVGDLTLDLQDCPIALDPKAYNNPGLEHITLYPPPEFRDRIKDQTPPFPPTAAAAATGPVQEVRMGGAFLRAGASVQISAAINGLFVNPWVYWRSPSLGGTQRSPSQ